MGVRATRRISLPLLEMRGAVLPIRGVVILAAIDWESLKQRPHHLAECLAAHGLSVLFIENIGTRVPGLRDASRITARLRAIGTGRVGRRVPGVTVLAPLVPPFPYSPPASSWTAHRLLAQIDEHLSGVGRRPEESVLLTYMATPPAVQIANALPWAGVVYDIVSDPKNADSRVVASEEELLHRADLVLFASEELRRQYGATEPKRHVFRDGFSTHLVTVTVPEAPEMARLPKPRLIYLGGINKKIWTEAVGALSDAIPEGSLVMVGSTGRGESVLPVRSNVYILPPVPVYEQLAGLLRAADVGLVPYRPDRFSGAMHPAKLGEYTVFGLPIVATETPEMARLATLWPAKSIYLTASLSEFGSAVRRALADDTPELHHERLAFAQARTWEVRTDELIRLIEQQCNASGLT